MTNEEVNKIIAEFMGSRLETVTSWDKKQPYCRLVDHNGSFKEVYTKSLDALVPVWEKLESDIIHLCMSTYSDARAAGFYDSLYGCEHFSKKPTIQQAAAHATAKAITELEG